MSSRIPPVPQRTPLTDQSNGLGLVNSIWSDWFNKVFQRVGGNVALTNDELETSVNNITTTKIADLAVTTAKIANLNVTAAKIADGVIAFAKFLGTDWTNSIAASGSQKLPSGLILKWGVTGSVSSGSTQTVTPASAFPTACLQAFASVRDNSGVATTATGQWGTGNYSASAFDIYNRTSVALTFNWMAVGH